MNVDVGWGGGDTCKGHCFVCQHKTFAYTHIEYMIVTKFKFLCAFGSAVISSFADLLRIIPLISLTEKFESELLFRDEGIAFVNRVTDLLQLLLEYRCVNLCQQNLCVSRFWGVNPPISGLSLQPMQRRPW